MPYYERKGLRMDDDASGFEMGMFAGIAIGVMLGLLFAPQAGIKTRLMLRKKALEIQEAVGEVAEKLE
jgi:gas vesicle protein